MEACKVKLDASSIAYERVVSDLAAHKIVNVKYNLKHTLK